MIEIRDGFHGSGPGVIDLRDSFVLPGLIDSHVHLVFENGPNVEFEGFKKTSADLAFDGYGYATKTLRADAVSWWNAAGRSYGAKAPEVRQWMLKSDNYVIDYYSINRSAGAKLGNSGVRYLPPLK